MLNTARVKQSLYALAGVVAMPESLFANDDSLSFELAYTAEVWGLASGGNDKGFEYLDNLYAGLEKSWESTGTTIYLSGLYNNGQSFAGNHVGDAQVISNIEAPVRAARAYEVWLEQHLTDSISIKAGLLDTNAEFDVLDSSGMFLGSAHGIGSDIGQTGENGPSIFPITALGVRFQAALTDELIIRTALIDGVPGDPDHLKKTTIKLGNGDGAFSISELEYHLPRAKVLAGYWRYTADFETHAGTVSDSNDGYYLRGEAQISGADGENGLYIFGRVGVADSAINAFSAFYSAGVRMQGVFAPEKADAVGLAFAWAETSKEYQQLVPFAPDREIAIELTYQLDVNDWFSIQPDVQYIVNPFEGAKNALAFGIRTTFTLP
ncbi:carbohydrate porin [Kordiimonas pumila]|uniref:Carbohydrate porin n=1 Tax=Kordiimonas pumila TaxID=2161677 RepID=A0ABV7D7T3_9PROT|nr:carbohydrate porin [Kordiimonas pumila]